MEQELIVGVGVGDIKESLAGMNLKLIKDVDLPSSGRFIQEGNAKEVLDVTEEDQDQGQGDSEDIIPMLPTPTRRYPPPPTLLEPHQQQQQQPQQNPEFSPEPESSEDFVYTHFDTRDSKGCWGSSDSSSSTGGVPATRMPCFMESETYNMNHAKRGKAVIFNHENFNSNLDLGRRFGTEKDKLNLKKSLTNLGFEVLVHEDLTYHEVVREIEALTKEDHSHRDCLVIAVLSHGDTNIMYAKDFSYKSDMLWHSFTADKVPTLAGKPKMFFIQACQGSQLDEGTKLVKVNHSEVDSNPQSYRIPNHADFLIAYSTFPGHYAWRNTTNGSWFIQALCTVFDKYAMQKDLLAMMTIVCRQVAIHYESNCPSMPHMHQKKQIPFVTSTLIRDVYIVPRKY